MSAAHRVARPSWTCAIDGLPWPCTEAQQALSSTDPTVLRKSMAKLMAIAQRELDDTDPATLSSDDVREVRTPAAFPKLFRTARDWGYESEPQPHAAGRRFYLPRGRTLGGSSSINAMIYIRGHRADYDEWAETAGPEWSWERVLPFFKLSEDQERIHDDLHGQGGPLSVADQRSPREMSRAFVEAAVEAGFTRSPDFNGPEQDGFGLYQVTQRRGLRASTAEAFLAPARSRPGLEVVTGAHVTRIAFSGRRAVRVEGTVGGEARTWNVDGEVILAAGAFGSPHLLLCSGVGDAAHLRAHGVEVVLDRPAVGRNLQDHLYATTVFRCGVDATLDTVESWRHLPGNLLAFLCARRGPLTSNVGRPAVSCARRAGWTPPTCSSSSHRPSSSTTASRTQAATASRGRRCCSGRGAGAPWACARPTRAWLRSSTPDSSPKITTCARW